MSEYFDGPSNPWADIGYLDPEELASIRKDTAELQAGKKRKTGLTIAQKNANEGRYVADARKRARDGAGGLPDRSPEEAARGAQAAREIIERLKAVPAYIKPADVPVTPIEYIVDGQIVTPEEPVQLTLDDQHRLVG